MYELILHYYYHIYEIDLVEWMFELMRRDRGTKCQSIVLHRRKFDEIYEQLSMCF